MDPSTLPETLHTIAQRSTVKSEKLISSPSFHEDLAWILSLEVEVSKLESLTMAAKES